LIKKGAFLISSCFFIGKHFGRRLDCKIQSTSFQKNVFSKSTDVGIEPAKDQSPRKIHRRGVADERIFSESVALAT
jgi:hypothetical protein